MENLYYTAMSTQRSELRKKWNGTNTDWNQYLAAAELRAQKVFDAIKKPISNFTIDQIESMYNDLYKTVIDFPTMTKENLLSGFTFEFSNDDDLMLVEFSQSLGNKKHFKIFFNSQLIKMYLGFPQLKKEVEKLVTKYDLILDLSKNPELLPIEVQNILNEYLEEGDLYSQCAELLDKLRPLGYTFEYGLDGIPFNLQTIKN